MTPKEKALQIFLRFKNSLYINNPHLIEDSKQSALICVDEIKQYESLDTLDFWDEVKNEIELL